MKARRQKRHRKQLFLNGKLVPMWKAFRYTVRLNLDLPDIYSFKEYRSCHMPEDIERVVRALYLHEQLKLAGTLRITHDYDKEEMRVERWMA